MIVIKATRAVIHIAWKKFELISPSQEFFVRVLHLAVGLSNLNSQKKDKMVQILTVVRFYQRTLKVSKL